MESYMADKSPYNAQVGLHIRLKFGFLVHKEKLQLHW